MNSSGLQCSDLFVVRAKIAQLTTNYVGTHKVEILPAQFKDGFHEIKVYIHLRLEDEGLSDSEYTVNFGYWPAHVQQTIKDGHKVAVYLFKWK